VTFLTPCAPPSGEGVGRGSPGAVSERSEFAPGRRAALTRG